MTARNRELFILMLAAIVASGAFATAWFREAAQIDYGWVPWALLLGGVFAVAHLVARMTVPDADPTLLPITALLCALGLTFVYRLDPEGGRKQLVWVAVGVAAFAAVLFWLRWDYRVLERYKYIFGVSAIVLLMLPSAPGLGEQINGVKLWVTVGPLQFQPGELAKIFLVIFLAAYLRDKREALARLSLKDVGPLVAIWGAAMLVLVQTSDLGSALLNFGIFLAMLYAATARASFVAAGLVLFAGGAVLLYDKLDRVQQRVTVWLEPWTDDKVYCAHNQARWSSARTATRTSWSRASTRSRTAATAAPGSETGRSSPSTARVSSRTSRPTSSTPRSRRSWASSAPPPCSSATSRSSRAACASP